MILCSDYRADFVGLERADVNVDDGAVIESPTTFSRFLQPPCNGLSSDSLDSGNAGFTDAFHTECGNLVEHPAAMRESVVWRAFCRTERLSATTAALSTMLPRLGLVESVTGDVVAIRLLEEATF